MTQLTVPNPQELEGQTLFDAQGGEVGTIEGVYLDNATRDPEWAAVRLGPRAIALVPLAEAAPAGSGVRVAFSRAMIEDAPHHQPDLFNEITEATEADLYSYYGMQDGATEWGDSSETEDEEPAAVEAAREVAETAAAAATDVAEAAKDQATEVVTTARDVASDVASTAKDRATEVAGTAKEETAEVVHVAANEARELLETTTTELQQQAETQLAQFAETLHRVAGETLALARGNPEQAGPLAQLVGRAGRELQSVGIDLQTKGSAGLMADAQRVVKQRPRGAIFGTALAVVAGAKLMGTPAGDKLKEKLAPLKDQAIDAGRTVAEELKPVAQARAERVRTVATQAADRVKQDAQGTAADVKVTAARSARTVKGQAKASATTVKGTAKRSTSAVQTTARRSPRTAVPIR